MTDIEHPHETARVWSPDGSRLATAGLDGYCRIWAPDSPGPLLELPHFLAVLALAWSPDGARIVTGGESDHLHIWDATTGEHLRRLPSDLAVLDLAWHSDDTISALTADGVESWQADTGKFLGLLPPRSYPPHCADIRTAAWSSRGPILVTAQHSEVEVRDLHGTRLRPPIACPSPCAAAISPDGDLLALTSHHDAPSIWPLTGGHVVAELAGVRHHWTHLAWHDDSARLLLYGGPSPALLWDRTTSAVTNIPGEGLGRARCIAWHTDRFVAANPRIGLELHDNTGLIARTPDALWHTPSPRLVP